MRIHFYEFMKIHAYESTQSNFLAISESVYVDHAGTTLYSKSQIEAHHKELLSNLYGNPHSRSQSSQLTTDAIDQIRYR